MKTAQDEDHLFMGEALSLAKEAGRLREVPIGAVVVYEGKIVGKGYNRRETDQDPLAHAELLAIKEAAAALGRWRLSGCTLYVTLEPCAMCAGALVNARLDRVVYGAKDPKAGATHSLYEICNDVRLNHRLHVRQGVLEDEASNMLTAFFMDLRAAQKTKPKEDAPLERKSKDKDVLTMLKTLELRAFEKSGRLDELKKRS